MENVNSETQFHFGTRKRGNSHMKNKKRLIVMICAILACAGLLVWYLNRGGSGGSQEGVYVQSIASMQGNVLADRYAGVVESQQTADFKAAAGREIDEILVIPGQNVSEGMPLFRYSIRDAENKVASAELEIENYNNQISILASSGNSADIQLQIRQLQYQIQVQQQEIAGYEQEINNAEVKSTIDGVVKSVNETGIGADGMEAPIVVVAETGDFRIKGKISEQTIGSFYPGMSVFVRSRVHENQVWHGEISSVDSEPESNNNEYWGAGEMSSKYPFYVTLEKTDGLMLGQHVFIEPDFGQGEKKEGIWLDMSFVAYEEDGTPFVWCGTSGKMKKQKVTLGEMSEESWQVQILEGLNEKDLIAFPDESITEGMKAISPEGE